MKAAVHASAAHLTSAGRSEAVLSRRPVLAMEVDPRWGDADADRMAEEHQYLRNDVAEALAAFRRRRAETLAIFGKVSGPEWDKGGIHPTRGRFTIDQVLTIMAWHDDNHLDQIRRALDGRS